VTQVPTNHSLADSGIALWMRDHLELAAFLAVVTVFVIRFIATSDRYLSPDEALHVETAGAADLIQAYQNSQFLAHPPLFILLLRFWLRAGRSEFFLRSLPAILGVGFLWSLRQWGGSLLGKVGGAMTLLVVGLSTSFLALFAEVRQYSLFLFLSVASLALLEDAFQKHSSSRMVGSALLLYLAVLSHYAAIFVTVSAFVYAAIRFWSSPPSRSLLVTWLVCQIGAAGLYGFLYVTQVTRLQGTEAVAVEGWIHAGIFNQNRGKAAGFLVRQSFSLFRYLFGSPVAAIVALGFAAVGILVLALGRKPSAVLLVLPGLIGAVAGLARLYPFGGTRHSAYVLPFVGAAFGAAAAKFQEKWSPALFVSGAAVVPLLFGTPDWSSPAHSLPQMRAAIASLQRAVPPGGLLLADNRTRLVLRYYLVEEESGARSVRNSYRIVRYPAWASRPEKLAAEVRRIVETHRLSAGKRFWLARLGSDYDPSADLARLFPGDLVRVVVRQGDVLVVEILLRQ
jgi:Dolichyl-phosphate-mannose-protein mannosyltransferase